MKAKTKAKPLYIKTIKATPLNKLNLPSIKLGTSAVYKTNYMLLDSFYKPICQF